MSFDVLPPRFLVVHQDRMKIVDWCYRVIDHCKMDRETVTVEMDIADRFFSNQSSFIAQRALLQCRDYELVVMTSLYLAIKLHERVLFRSDLFAEMSNGVYSVDKIERTEIHRRVFK
jgi:hypothetical protein